MRLLPSLLAVAALASASAASAATVTADGVTAEVTPDRVVLRNALVQRTWRRDGLRSTIVDLRGPDTTWSADQPDFALTVAGQELSSADFRVTGVRVAPLPRRGLRVVMELAGPLPALNATRVVEAYPGVAGFRSQTTLSSPVPLPLSAASLDQAAVGADVAPTIHAFRAGADWRGESNWTGPQYGSVGDPHAGDWRDSRSAAVGQSLAAPGQWITLARGDRSLFQVLERDDLPSSRAAYDGAVATTRVDFTRDVLSLGPLEEMGHVENPADVPAGRARTIGPGGLRLPATFLGVGRGDGDEAWQFHRYLVDHRLTPYAHDVVFNSDGTKVNAAGEAISTGAKDGMDEATVEQVAPLARRLGVDVFTLDDGWQAASGDWYPDSPEHPEPRGRFGPRFPDATFAATRAAIAPMKLGLWMSPLNYNSGAETFKAHPEWSCHVLGDATAAYTAADPNSSSNEAGLGLWSTAAYPWVASRLRDAIANWQVKLFKFDFMVWADCAGANDLYEAKDRFVAMIDRLRADFPDVTFQIDETNDYRLFPFDSVVRGPTWFTNGGPSLPQVLHNTWSLSPWIPAFALGQKTLTPSQRDGNPTSTVIAATLLNQQLVAEDLRAIPLETVDAARRWFDWGKEHRRALDGVVYPLLDDPLQRGWTALQSWDPEGRRGVLLAFRQDDPAQSAAVALRNVPDGTYELRAAPDDALVGTVRADELRAGLPVTLPQRGARVLLIRRVR